MEVPATKLFPSPFPPNEGGAVSQLSRGMAQGIILQARGRTGLIEVDGFRYEYSDERKKVFKQKYPLFKFEGQAVSFTFWPAFDAEQKDGRDPFDPPTLKIANLRQTMPDAGFTEVIGRVEEVGDGYVRLASHGSHTGRTVYTDLLGEFDGKPGTLVQAIARLAEGGLQLERWQSLEEAPEPEVAILNQEQIQDQALAALATRAKTYALNSKAANTLKAYRADWRKFTAWCEERGLIPLPAAPETVAMFAAELAGTEKASTLQRRMSAIAQAHKTAGQESPTRAGVVQNVLAGIRRSHGSAQEGKAALLTEDIKAMVASCGEDLAGHRDRALILLGFAGAFRRSELVALQVEDLAFTSSGLVVTLRRSKTDQEGQGAKRGIPFGAGERSCPVHAVRKWLEAGRLSSGPLFRGVTRWGQVQITPLSDRAVALIVKKLATAVGLSPERYAGHSLRAGLATQAAMNGVEERVIQSQTGHKSVTVLRRYIRDGSLFRQNAASSIGL